MRSLPAIRTSDEVAQFIRTLHPQIKRRVHDALEALRADPDSGKRLRDELEAYRSFRVGTFRIVYRVVAREEIEIVTVGPRRTVYEESLRIIARKG